MILSELVSKVNHGLLQNYGTIMTDNSDIVFTISNMLDYLYSYRVWKWALIREEITSISNVYTLSNNAITIFKVVGSDNEYKDNPVPFGLTDDGIDGSSKYFHSGKSISLSKNEPKITVWYLKTPARMQMNDINNNIDLPDNYITILYFLCMWNLYPYNLENGASLANNFKGMADDVLKVYEKTHSLGIAPTAVQWADAFNGR